MKRLLAAAVLALVACVSAPAATLPPVSGGVPAQAKLLRRIIARMGPLDVRSVQLLRARTHHWSVYSPKAVVLRFNSPASDVRTEWKEWLIAGALRDRSGRAGLPSVSILEGTHFGGMRLSGVGRVHARKATRANVLRLRRRLLRVARQSGARVDHLSIVRPYGLAYTLVLRVQRPARYLRFRARKLLTQLRDTWSRYEGAYLEVVDRDGKRVWLGASSSRLSTGAGWIRPDLEGCSPTDVSWPSSHKVPPCPV